MGGGRHGRIGGGRAEYFSCGRGVIVDVERAAVLNFRFEDAVHDVSGCEAEYLRCHGLPLVEAISLKYRAVLLS